MAVERDENTGPAELIVKPPRSRNPYQKYESEPNLEAYPAAHVAPLVLNDQNIVKQSEDGGGKQGEKREPRLRTGYEIHAPQKRPRSDLRRDVGDGGHHEHAPPYQNAAHARRGYLFFRVQSGEDRGLLAAERFFARLLFPRLMTVQKTDQERGGRDRHQK